MSWSRYEQVQKDIDNYLLINPVYTSFILAPPQKLGKAFDDLYPFPEPRLISRIAGFRLGTLFLPKRRALRSMVSRLATIRSPRGGSARRLLRASRGHHGVH